MAIKTQDKNLQIRLGKEFKYLKHPKKHFRASIHFPGLKSKKTQKTKC